MKLPKKLYVEHTHGHSSNTEFITTVPTRALINFFISNVKSFDELKAFREHYMRGLKAQGMRGRMERQYAAEELVNVIISLIDNDLDCVAIINKIANRNSIDISKFPSDSRGMDYNEGFLPTEEASAMESLWIGCRESDEMEGCSVDFELVRLEVEYEKLMQLAKSLHGCLLSPQQYDNMASKSHKKQLDVLISLRKNTIREEFPLIGILEERHGQGFDILFLSQASKLMNRIKRLETLNNLRAPKVIVDNEWKMLAEARQEFESFTTYNKTDVYSHLLDFYLFEHGSYLPNAPKGTSKKIGELTPFIKDLWECCESANNRKDDIWKKGVRMRGAGFSKQ
jgi:hypothetical protein|tara:strand:+ start:51 stop:1070 length:1020 start_codon:yes stop_codon:yes gene_type:complete